MNPFEVKLANALKLESPQSYKKEEPKVGLLKTLDELKKYKPKQEIQTQKKEVKENTLSLLTKSNNSDLNTMIENKITPKKDATIRFRC